MKYGNKGKGGKSQSYTSPQAAAWRANFDANSRAQESAFSEPYNNGTLSGDVTSIYNAPSVTKYDQYLMPIQEEPSWFSKIISFIPDKVIAPPMEGLAKVFSPDTWRLWNEQRLMVDASKNEENLMHTKDQLDDINKYAEDYIELLKDYKSALDDYNRGGLLTDEYRVKQAEKKLLEMESMIRAQSRNSNALLDLFYDDSKSHSLDNKLQMRNLSLGDREDNNPNSHKKLNIFEKAAKFFSDALSNVSQDLASVIGGFDDSDRMKRAIRNSSGFGEHDNLTREYFKSFKDNKDIQSYIDDIESNYWKKRNDLEHEIDVYDYRTKESVKNYKNGTWYFDPKKIDQKFKSGYENNNSSLLSRVFNPKNWAYNVVDTGSSFSMAQNMFGQMAFQAGNQLVANAIIASLGGWESALAKGVSTAVGVGGGLYLANLMRKDESSSEVMDAYSSRLIQYAYNNKISLVDLNKKVDEHAKLMGIDTSRLNDTDRMQLALAYNIKSDSKQFEEERQLAKNGLDRVYNDNMTLSTMDYLEVIPFLNFGGKVAAKSILGGVKNKIFKQYLKYGKGVTEEVADRFIAQNANRAARTITDNLIDKAFGEGAEAMLKKVKTAHVLDFLKRKAGQITTTGVLEGIEEGQQHLLQQRYQRGEYDNYNSERSNFDINSLLSDVRLGIGAVAGYFGLNFGDPDNGTDELRKAMNTGFVASMLTSQGMSSMTNLLPTRVIQKMGLNPDNIRGLKSQLNADNIINELVASNYAAEQDDDHVDLFFKSLMKGNSVGRIKESLNEMKKFKGDLVDNQFIDDDIRLLNTTNHVINNKRLHEILGVDSMEDTFEHRNIVQDAVKTIIDFEDLEKLHKDNVKDTEALQQKIIQEITGDENSMSEPAKRLRKSILLDYSEYKKSRDSQIDDIINKDKSILDEARQTVLSQYEDDVDNSTLQKYIKEEARSIAEAKLDDKLITEEDYIKNRTNLIFSNLIMDSKTQLLNQLKQQDQMSRLIREETGTDIDVSKLGSIIRNLSKDIKNQKEYGKKLLKEVNDQIDAKNKLIDEYNKNNPNKQIKKHKYLTIKDIVSNYSQVDQADELQKLYQINAFNEATLKSLSPIYQAYTEGLSDLDQSLTYSYGVNWNDLTVKEKEAYKRKVIDDENKNNNDVSQQNDSFFKNRYRQEQSKNAYRFNQLKQLGRQISDKLQNEDLDLTPAERIKLIDEYRELAKEAAKLVIQSRANEKHNRKLVAHKRFLEEGGITNDDIDNLNTDNEDPSVRDVIDQLAGRQIEEDSVILNNNDDGMDSSQYEESEPNLNEIQGKQTDNGYDDDLQGEGKDLNDADVIQGEQNNNDGLDSNLDNSDNDTNSGTNTTGNEHLSDAQRDLKRTLFGEESERPKKDIKLIHADNIEDAHKEIQKKLDEFKTIKDIFNIPNNTTLIRFTVKDGFYSGVVSVVVSNSKGVVEIKYLDESGQPVPLNIENTGFNMPEEFVPQDEDYDSQRFTIIKKLSDTLIEGHHIEDALTGKIYKVLADKIAVKRSRTEDVAESKPQDQNDNDTQPDEQPDESYNHDDLDNDGELQVNGAEADGELVIDDMDDSYTPEPLWDENVSLDDIRIDNRLIDNKEDVYRNLLAATFFYNNTSTDIINLSVDGTQLKFKYPIKSNSELSKKLTQKGWFESTKKYYVVSGKNGSDKNSFTVSLVIEDEAGKSTYITTMKTPSNYTYTDSQGFVRREDGIGKLKHQLQMIGVDKELLPQAQISSREDYYSLNVKARPQRGNYNTDEAYNAALKHWYKEAKDWYEHLSYEGNEGKIKSYIDYKARVIAKKSNGKGVLTDEQIEEQIQNLITSRDQIIEAYCEKVDGKYIIPNKIRTDVVPTTPRISNGSITKGEEFHSIAEQNNEFGIPTDIKEIDKQVKDKELVFGYGTGKFGDIQYAILGLNDSDAIYTGTGYSGTVYILVEGPSGSTQRVPVSLSEQRFNTTDSGKAITSENLQLSINPTTGELNTQAKPTAAEVLLYMICGKLNQKYIPGATVDIMRQFADLIINNGENTVKKMSNTQASINKQPFLADKQLAVVDNHGTASLQIVTKEDGQRKVEYIPLATLFSENESETRKRVVLHIADNMHWNTSVEAMMDEFPFDIINTLKNFFQNNKKETKFSICGLEQLTFNKSDLFDESNGQLKYNRVNVISWMIKTGRLLTTTSRDGIFQAPFVYASGVQASESKKAVQEVKQKVEQTEADKKAGTVTVNPKTAANWSARTEKSKIERVKDKFGVKRSEVDKWFAKDRKDADERLSALNAIAEEHGGITDLLILDIDKSDLKIHGDSAEEKMSNYAKDYKSIVLSKLEAYIDQYEKETGIKLDINNIEVDEKSIARYVKSISKNTVVPQVVVYKDGKGMLFFTTADELLSRTNTYSGVFSTEEQQGQMSIDESREWLSEKLGIEKGNVIVIDGVMKSASDEDVFGLMTVVSGILSNGDNPVFMLSNKAGRGIQYHEAWHYVNLLLHNKYQRAAIYDRYVKAHKGYENYTYKQIEELIAEDFRRYAELQNQKGITGTIKRAFDDILKFTGLFNNRYVMYNVFNDINSGKYKSIKIDKESLETFKKAYSGGAASKDFHIPGVDQNALNKLSGIDTRQKFFQTATSLANKLLYDYSLDTIESINRISYKDIDEFLKSIKSTTFSQDPSAQAMAKSIADNPEAFIMIINNILKQYSIQIKEDAFKIEQTQKEESVDQSDQDVGKKSENSFDRDAMTISKKDNIAARAKLFLGQIKKAHIEIDEFTGEPEFIYDVEPVFGSPEFYSFGEVWNNLLNNLWDTESYGEVGLNNEYRGDSIRGAVKRLAKSSVFFKSLDKKLDLIEDDIELQSQIHSTIRSQMAQMMQIWIKNPKVKKSSYDFDDGSLDDYDSSQFSGKIKDIRRQWEIINDNQLKAIKAIPRIWSQSIYQSGLVHSDNSQTVSVQYATSLLQKLNDCRVYKPKGKLYPTTDEQLDQAYYQLSNKILDIFNFMGISVDKTVLDKYVSNEVGDKNISNKRLRYNTLLGLINSDKLGSVSKIIRNVYASRGQSSLKSGTTRIDLDRALNGYGDDSQISKLAKAYNECYPSPQQFSITAPDNTQRYPITENNTMSDVIRNLNHNKGGIIENLRKSEYCKHSILLDAAEFIDHESSSRANQLKLNYFVGLKDVDENIGNDYLGITQLEDYLAKMFMTEMDMIVLPTMADKKTWYSISSPSIKMPHNCVTYDNFQLDSATLERLRGYFIDEFNSVKQYYSRENVKYLLENPSVLRKNFHGKIEDGKLQFGGNGGLFRYFSDIFGDEGVKDLNSRLNYLYLKQQRDMEANGKLEYRNINEDGEIDGFESIRAELDRLEKYLQNSNSVDVFIQKKIYEMVQNEIAELSKEGNLNLGKLDSDGRFIPTKIPTQLLEAYAKRFKDLGLFDGYFNTQDTDSLKNFALSLITNNVLSSIISVIEIEKVFSGDPAFYELFSTKQEITGEDGQKYSVLKVVDKHSNKIKRLGALLSPGQKIRIDYNDKQVKQYPELADTKYTVLNVSDIKLKSSFFDQALNIFKRQYAIDFIHETTDKDFINKLLKKFEVDSIDELTSKMYVDEDLYNNVLKEMPANIVESFKTKAEQDVYVYSKVNVSDAQVIIRPDLYRKIRIGLGDWTFGDEFSEYSDEQAFNILQNDPDWQSDPQKAKIVSKLELYPLKMSYFQNSSSKIGNNAFYNLPIYNKMAIFPAFKYMLQSDNGKALYDRMNKPGEEIDMIAFDSAVKVGGNQNQYQPYKGKVNGLENMNKDGLNDNLDIQVQDLDDLRMQLNTEAHHELERAFGTQALKILMSNIIDSADYGIGKNGDIIKGKQLRRDIINLINALTLNGINTVKGRFLLKDGSPNKKAVMSLLSQIIKSNDIGYNALETILSGGVVDTLGSRTIFEQSLSKYINKKVVDVNLKGGSCIQQSVFGLIGSNKVDDEEGGFHVLNNGEKLNWFTKDNSMEIMISVRLLRSIIPVSEQTSYNNMRQWLIDNDIIKGVKSGKDKTLTKQQIKFNDDLDDPIKSGVLSTKTYVELENNNLVSLQDVIDNKDKLSKEAIEQIDEFMKSHGFKDGINTVRFSEKTVAGELSNPKPIGIGYRIPTQGMSSIFAFTIADILPEQNGDNIIVPEEFTAQTGSDFDVDKIFIALKSFRNGMEMSVPNSVLSSEDVTPESIESDFDEDSIRGALVQKYIDVLTDVRTLVDARGSIDTVTGIIRYQFVPKIRPNVKRKYMYELLPSFQSKTKAEFITGKDGIAPYALATTNLALTQTAHLTMDFGSAGKIYGLNPLDQIKSEDGLYISAWLSAMVNAHVDVAKDPYVSVLNVNNATYSISELLIRAGKGISTFSFLAQPALVEYANAVNNYGGLYSASDNDDVSLYKFKEDTIEKAISKYKGKLSDMLRTLDSDESLTKEEISERRKFILNVINNTNGFIFKNSGVAMDYEKGIHAINNPDSYEGVLMQIFALYTLKALQPYADSLNALVRNSQIDTKKFGNTLTHYMNFENKLLQFINLDYIPTGHSKPIQWKINLPEYSNLSSKEALLHYFNNAWLGDKFYNASSLLADVLNKSSITASPEYMSLFRSIMYKLLGDPFNINEEDNVNCYYRQTSDEKLITSIGSFITSIARNNMLFNSSIMDGSQNDEQSGVIDFTMRRNKATIFNKLLKLIYGDVNDLDSYYHNNIFTNYSNFVYRLKNGLLGEEFNDLLDSNGNINNEFLNYYMAKTDNKLGIGRFTTRMTYINTDPIQRAKLESSLHQLLTHKNERVRRLFRDIIFYDYYSTYNSNSVHSIFDITPVQFKQQYIQSISDAINSGNLYQYIYEDNSNANVEEYIDSICRNFWYNDSVVPEYSITNQAFASTVLYTEKYTLPTFINGSRVPGAIITSKGGNNVYIKIKIKNNTYIYKKIGSIYKNEKESHSVYAITPKLGISADGVNQYELVSGSTGSSLFGSNMLPDSVNYNAVIQSVRQFVALHNEAIKNKKKAKPIRFVIGDSIAILSPYNYYKVSSVQENSWNLTQNVNGDVKIAYTNNPEKDAKSQSDVILKFNEATSDGVTIDTTKSVESQVEAIMQKYSNINKDNTIIKIFADGSTANIDVTEKEIDDVVQQYSKKLEDTLRENGELTQDEIIEAVNKYELQLLQEGVVQKIAKQQKLNKFADLLIKHLLTNNYKIGCVYTTSTTEGGEAIVRAAQANKDDIFYSYPAYIYMDKKSYTKDNIDNIAEQISKFDETDNVEEYVNKESLNDAKSSVEAIQLADDILSKQNEQKIESVTKELESVDGLLSGLQREDESSLTDSVVEDFNDSNLKSTEQTPDNVKSNHFYNGIITPSEDTVFVFGSNPQGRHGAGAAKVAVTNFGAKYGQGEGLQGNSYALPTKDLRVKTNRSLRSISEDDIVNSIRKMYDVARNNKNKLFKVAYTNTTTASLNGYTGIEMAEMFKKAGPIPTNVQFSDNWSNLISDQDFENNNGGKPNNTGDVNGLLNGLQVEGDLFDDSQFDEDSMNSCLGI